ncbi:MAG: Hsp20/alpha crystallin family protein [Planctomycetota bacterium]
MIDKLARKSETSDLERSFRSLQREVNRLFGDWFDLGDGFGALSRWQEHGEFVPRMDVTENNKEVKVTVELPGMEEKDVQVSLNRNLLTIQGRKETEKEEQDATFHCIERTHGSFQRTLELPFEVDAEKAEARFKKGVLRVILPNPVETQAEIRRLPIRTD